MPNLGYGNRGKHCILIIDDSRAQLMELERILFPEYYVIRAKSGEEGLVVAHDNDVDLVLLDLVMTGITGFEVLSLLKDSSKTRHIPVIFITGSGSNEDEAKGLSLGAVDYIRKPFAADVVKLRLKIHLQLTEQKKAIESSITNEQTAVGLTRILLDTSPMLIELWDEDFNIVDCNRQTLGMFCVSNIEEYKNRYNEFSPEIQPCGTPSKELKRCYAAKVVQEGIVRYEWMHQLPDGTPLPVEVILARVEHSGKFMYVEYTHDLRPVKAVLFRERNTAELNNLLVESMPLFVEFWKEPSGPYDCNQQVLKAFGLSDKKEYFKRYHEFSPELQPCGTKSRDLINTLFSSVMKEGNVKFEYVRRDVNGSPFPMNCTAVRIEFMNEPIIICYANDLRAIKSIASKAKRADEKAQLLLETLPLPYVLFDAEFKAVDCNPSALTLFLMGQKIEPHQYSKIAQAEWISACNLDFDNCKKIWSEDCCGRQCFMKNYRLIFPDYAQNQAAVETFIAYHCGLAVEAIAEDRVHGFEYDLVTFYKEPVPCRITIIPVSVYEEMSYAVYIRDLREEKQTEAAKKESLAKTRFLARMSHEIRTPMNAILGIAETQLQKKGHLAETEDAFLRINNSSQMLLQVINDILDMSKVEAGKMKFIPSTYDIASLVVDSVQLNLMYKNNEGIHFKLYADENLPAFMIGDELRIKQIINNLLSNAFKYTQEGSVSLFFSFERIGSHDLMLIIEVSDTGQGLTQKQITRMFSEDYTRFNEQANQNIEGFGLGSSITFQLIQMMGGEMIVDSELGKGSTFIVRLPQKTDGSNRVLGKEVASNLERLDFSQRTFRRTSHLTYNPMPYGKVLVVDDMDSNLHVIKEMLSPYKINVETAKSGAEAISLIESGKAYDIIFMDHMMPEMDGIETANQITSMGYIHPIVALTANALKGMEEFFIDSGFSGFISKPIDMMELDICLNRFIRSKQQQHLAKKTQAIVGFSDGVRAEIRAKRLNESFVYDARIAIDSVEPIMEQQQWSDDAFDTFIIQTHGIKSALANIEQLSFSEEARVLEQAGKDRDLDTIKAQTPEFLDKLKELVASILLKETDGSVDDDDPEDLRVQLLEIGEACKLYDIKRAENILDALKLRPCSEETSAALKEISIHLLRGDFLEVIELSERTAERYTNA